MASLLGEKWLTMVWSGYFPTSNFAFTAARCESKGTENNYCSLQITKINFQTKYTPQSMVVS